MFKLSIDKDRCIGCGNCIITCPVNSAQSTDVSGGKGPLEEKRIGVALGSVSIYEDFCTGCGNCMKACTQDAIEVLPPAQETILKVQKVEDFMYGKKKEVYELIKSQGPMSISFIADKLGILPREASVYVYSLKSDGRVWEEEKNGMHIYSTQPKKKEEVKVKEIIFQPEIANEIKNRIDSMVEHFHKVKVRFLIETNKLDKAKKELTK